MKRLSAGILCFVIGLSIYLLFRDKVLLGFHLCEAIGIGGAVDELRASVSHISLPEFVLYSLPDGLWTVSYILIIDYVFRKQPLHIRIVWTAIIPFIGAVSELLQFVGIVPGVFDVADFLCYLVPHIIYIATTMFLFVRSIPKINRYDN